MEKQSSDKKHAAHDTSHIFTSLMANTAIALAKGVAAFFTRSGSMLAEALHSLADCTNQILLLVGIRRAQKPPDKEHPLGYGRSVYFWSFMVALLLFSGGGLFSINEGVHKLEHPEPPQHIEIGIAILAFGIILDGYALFGNIKALNKLRGDTSFFKYLARSKDSDLVVLFAENGGDVIGLTLGLIALSLASITGDPMWDSIGSLSIGFVLVGISVFLAREIHALLLGEAADNHIEVAVREIVKEHKSIENVIEIISIQQGPGEVLVALKLGFDPKLTAVEVSNVINDFEVKLRERCHDAKWVFVEPDLLPENAKPATAKPATA